MTWHIVPALPTGNAGAAWLAQSLCTTCVYLRDMLVVTAFGTEEAAIVSESILFFLGHPHHSFVFLGLMEDCKSCEENFVWEIFVGEICIEMDVLDHARRQNVRVDGGYRCLR